MSKPSFEIERELHRQGYVRVAGLDEAGRGCLAGPVVAAAAVLPSDVSLPRLDDSKKLSPATRAELHDIIHAEALAIGIGACTAGEIDQMNILWASLEAMRRAVLDLALPPDHLLIDGKHTIPDVDWLQNAVVKGDGRSLSIAAASVVAKVTRDRQMETLHAEFPQYGWASHKGYPTSAHYGALRTYGPSPYHRRSFRLA